MSRNGGYWSVVRSRANALTLNDHLKKPSLKLNMASGYFPVNKIASKAKIVPITTPIKIMISAMI